MYRADPKVIAIVLLDIGQYSDSEFFAVPLIPTGEDRAHPRPDPAGLAHLDRQNPPVGLTGWAFYADAVPVAALTSDARVHLNGESIDLKECASLWEALSMTFEFLGDVLPRA